MRDPDAPPDRSARLGAGGQPAASVETTSPMTRRPRTRPAEMTGRYVYDVDPVDGEEAWALFEACRDGDLDRVRELIRHDPALVHVQYWYTQPIHFAVYANRPAVVRALLDAGAEPGRVRFMDSGWKKLVRRARTMGFDEVRGILEAEARGRFGYDPRFGELRDAMVAREEHRVAEMVRARPHLAAAADLGGNTAIHWAVMTRQPGLVPLLTAHGADPDARRSDGQTPAHLLYNGDYEFRVWRELKGISHAEPALVLAALADAGATLDLSVASASGDQARVEELLEEDPERARRLDSSRRNPLTYAARGGHPDLVRLLLSHGADPSRPEELAPHGHALWMACARGDAAMVEVLLEHGADPNSAPDSSNSCLGIAVAWAGDAAAAIERLLRDHGAHTPMWSMTNAELGDAITTGAPVSRAPDFAEEVIARNDLPLTELLLEADPDAARRLHGGSLRRGDPSVSVTSPAVLKRLLDAGFDPGRPDWLGRTALHHYARRGDVPNARLMLEHGADIDALDDQHHGTPLAWAARKGHEDMVLVLLSAGADPALPADIPPATPLAHARAAGHEGIASMLKEAPRREVNLSQ